MGLINTINPTNPTNSINAIFEGEKNNEKTTTFVKLLPFTHFGF